MARKLWIAPAALSDLGEIWDYIARDDPLAADRFLDRIYARLQNLAQTEGIGRLRPELAVGLLSLPFENYVFFFRRPDSSRLEVVRILHGRRDLGSQFEQ